MRPFPRCFLSSLLVFWTASLLHAEPDSAPGTDGPSARAYQVQVLQKIAAPVLTAAAENRLEDAVPKLGTERDPFRPLEALARTLTGIAPWLELGDNGDGEAVSRKEFLELATRAIGHAVDSKSTGFLFSAPGGQPLVDTAFFAEALLRSPKQLWGKLDAPTRAAVLEALKKSRAIKPPRNNWLLFSAMVEAALLEFSGECQMPPIEDAVQSHLDWYKGDGTYGDGRWYHWDYYNSFVIQPMFLEVLEVCARKNLPIAQPLPLVRARAQRYAAVQERMISPEGTFPVIGRSSAYRFGVFHHLSFIALRHELPKTIAPAAVRSALTAVIHRMITQPGVFDDGGWLKVGVVGAQPQSGENYINVGSLYLCTTAFVALGLPPDDPFWAGSAESWTQKRIWSGEDVPRDHAFDDEVGGH